LLKFVTQSIKMKKITTILSIVIILINYSNAQVIDIAAAKNQAVGASVTVQGTVLDDGQLVTGLRYIQDATGGIAIYDPNNTVLGSSVSGDVIEVSGSFEPYNELSEIVSLSDASIIGSEALPAPILFDNIADAFAEPYEGMLLTLNNVTFVDQGSFSASSGNYEVTDGSSTHEIRVNGGTDIAGTPIPSDPVNITGVMSQWTQDITANEGYQFLPLSLASFGFNSGAPIFASNPEQSNITTSGFDICFETINDGNTIINFSANPNFLSGEFSDNDLTTDHCISMTNLQPGTIYYIQATSEGSNGEASVSGVIPMATASLSSGEMRVFFNRPVDNSVNTGTNATYVDQAFADTIINFIQKAQTSIDFAIYNIDNDNFIIDALNTAYQNGITVRFLGDDDNTNATAYNTVDIGSANKKRRPYSSTQFGAMHNKFIIIDANSVNNSWILTGSTNMTDNQLNSDANNIIAIQDQSLAKAYTIEFEEMFVDELFGPDKSNNTPKLFSIDGKKVELFFSPSDDTETQIKNMINSADHDLYVAMFSHTRFGISYEIEDMLNEGVFVGGIVEDPSDQAFDVLSDDIPDQWIEDNNNYSLHHKYLIVDPNAPWSDPLVLTGSHNWSSNAQFNSDENTIIVHDATIANIYYQEWRRRFIDNGGNIFVGFEDAFETNKIEIFDLYPNPTKELLNFVFKADENLDYSISISDVNGRQVKVLNKSGLQGINKLSLSVEDFQTGIYSLTFNTNGFKHSKLFVVK